MRSHATQKRRDGCPPPRRQRWRRRRRRWHRRDDENNDPRTGPAFSRENVKHRVWIFTLLHVKRIEEPAWIEWRKARTGPLWRRRPTVSSALARPRGQLTYRVRRADRTDKINRFCAAERRERRAINPRARPRDFRRRSRSSTRSFRDRLIAFPRSLARLA